MQKISFLRWWSITQPAPMTPKLYTKVVFTQQIKRRLRLKTFFGSPVIVVSKSFGFTSMFVRVRPLFVISDWTKSQPGPQIVLMKVLLLQQMTGHILPLLWWKMVQFCWWWWGSLGLSGEVGRSWRYCNARPTRDEAGASSWTSSPCKNQFNIEGGTWPPYQILSW